MNSMTVSEIKEKNNTIVGTKKLASNTYATEN